MRLREAVNKGGVKYERQKAGQKREDVRTKIGKGVIVMVERKKKHFMGQII